MDNDILENDVNVLAMELKTEILKLEGALAQFETDIGLLQGGNLNELYWDGPRAYAFLKASMSHFDHDRVLLSNLNKCSDYLNSLSK